MSESRGTDTTPKRKDPYRHTLLLPRTRFSMKANLAELEPRIQRHWDRIGLYKKMLERDHPKGKFLFHDGPPYANGPIHMGHLLNKTLKDFVVRSKLMAGHEVVFVPGWDCHGLPIEHRVMKELGGGTKELETLDVRRRCQSYALRYVKVQSKQMVRLGTVGDYENPYLTMDAGYEADVLEVFAELLEKGLVYRALKPVHWSIENRTALADAELEYYERSDHSIYVLFEADGAERLPRSLNVPAGKPLSLMIWTTTPWTLPANLAVVVSPDGVYGLYRVVKDSREMHVLVALVLAERVFQNAGVSEYAELGRCTGKELAQSDLAYTHPFIARKGALFTADYVTFDEGTGLVHTAPGHGDEDYQTALRHGLEVYCPVLEDGTFDDSAPEWIRGRSVWEANELIIERLEEGGSLFHHERYVHNYPHDWRSKTPTIFRATEQWFIAVDKPFPPAEKSLRELALAAIDRDIAFVPEWGRNRMRGMLEARPDWCISRQRAWGLPIPAFHDESEEVLLTPSSVRAVAQRIRERGSNLWFREEPGELLSGYEPGDDAFAPERFRGYAKGDLERLRKGSDIFDVWFESGSSWNAVLIRRGLGYPAHLYLEGSDQHRGWFQTSLLPALGATGSPPYRGILTHGFMVDAEGKKMSKSVGNAIEVDDLLDRYGADVCRWWVSSLNYTNDVKVDWEFFKVASEEYRKVRNTLRFMLGNLSDFDPERDSVELGERDRYSVDAWALRETAELIRSASRAYEGYQYKRVNDEVFNFCNNTLSAVYLSALKDRLYCDPGDSRRRRRSQTVLYHITQALLRLVAPIVVHTAEDAYMCLRGEALESSADSVHLGHFPEPLDAPLGEGWDEVMALRERVLKEIEVAKEEKGILNPLDAEVEAVLTGEAAELYHPYVEELVDLCGVSRFRITAGDAEAIIVHDLRGEPRCERSWKRDGTVKRRTDGGMLSARDARAVGVS